MSFLTISIWFTHILDPVMPGAVGSSSCLVLSCLVHFLFLGHFISGSFHGFGSFPLLDSLFLGAFMSGALPLLSLRSLFGSLPLFLSFHVFGYLPLWFSFPFWVLL